MAEYELYCFAQSGNSYKVALMLETTGQSWTPRFVDFFNGETRSPDYHEVNIMGEVPVLVRGDMRLSQSGVILDYLAEQTGQYRWTSEEERRDILRWLLFDNHKLTGYTSAYRFMRNFIEEPNLAVLDFLGGRVKTAYSVFDAHMKDRDWVVGDRATIADLSICGYLFYEDEIGVDFAADYPAIAAWLERIKALPGWKHPYDLMPGHPLPKA